MWLHLADEWPYGAVPTPDEWYMQGIWTFLLGTSGGLLFLWQGLGACKKNTMWNSYPECLRWMVADISACVRHHPETFMVNGERCRTFADQRSMCPLDDKLRQFDSKMLASPEPHYTLVCCVASRSVATRGNSQVLAFFEQEVHRWTLCQWGSCGHAVTGICAEAHCPMR